MRARFLSLALRLVFATAATMVAHTPAWAQTARPTDLEAQLSTATGVARARLLSRLVDAYKLDKPAQAVIYGTQALEQLAHTPDSAAHVVTLSELGWAYMQLSRFDEAIASADSARRLAARTGQRKGEARAISNLGTIAQRRGEPEHAIQLFNDALVIQRTIGDTRDIANSLNNIGFVHGTDLADYPRALAEHLEALQLRETLNDSSAISLSLNNIGIVYGRLRQYTYATQYFDRALAIRRALGNPVRIAGTLSNLGDMYLESGKPARALDVYEEALELRKGANDPAAMSTSFRTIALSRLALGDTIGAVRDLAASEKAGAGLEDKGLLAGNLLARATLDRALGKTALAEDAASRALGIARAMNSRELVRRSLEALSSAQEASNSHLLALRSLQRAKAVSDSIYDDGSARRIAELETKFAVEHRVHEIARIKRDQAQAELRAERERSQRNIVIGIAAVLGVIGVVAYRRRHEHARISEQLSLTDPLTDARNRRYVEQTIGADLAVSARKYLQAAHRAGGATPVAEEADLVFLLLDLDKFKDINDRYGHSAGDTVLRDVVQVLRETCRQSDVVVRWGGEEFLIIGRFTERSLAAIHAERLRQAIALHVIRVDAKTTLNVTCSIGYAAYPFRVREPEAMGWLDVVALADHAAYMAKRRGRNRCVGLFAASGSVHTGATVTHDQVAAWVAEGALVEEAGIEMGERQVG